MTTAGIFRIALAVLLLSTAAAAQGPPDAARIDKLLDESLAASPSGRYLDMEKTAQEALRLSTEAGDKSRIARSLILLGSAYFYQTRLPIALDHLERGERLAIELDDVPQQKMAASVLGNTLRNLGRFDEALRKFDRWFALNAKQPKPDPEFRMTRTLAILYSEMGDYRTAETTVRKALIQAREAGDLLMETASTLTLGITLKNQGRISESVPVHEDALALARRGKFQSLEAEILNSLGNALHRLTRLDEAATRFREAMTLAVSISYNGLRAQVTDRLGTVELDRNRPAEAIEMFRQASELYRTLGNLPEKTWTVELMWGKAARALGRNDEALEHSQEALARIDRLEQNTVPTEIARAVSIAVRRQAFEETADLLVEMRRPGEALEIADRSRARAFIALLSESSVDLRAQLTADQRSREETLTRQVAASREKPEALSAALDGLEAFYVEVRRSNPAYAAIARPERASLARIQRELTDRDTAFLEYLLGETRSFAWVVTPTAVNVVVLPKRSDIQPLLDANRQALVAPVTTLTASRLTQQQREAGRKLYEALVTPLAEHLGSVTRLLIVPDGAMTYVPFEALVSARGEYLIERYAVTYGQSASASLALRTLPASGEAPVKTLLAVGDPSYGTAVEAAERGGAVWTALPNSREEVQGIGRLYPSGARTVLVGERATESTVKAEQLPQYRYIHFAVHGLMDEEHPRRSGLALSFRGSKTEDGMLRVDEITRLRLNADLVTLSACETGVGRLLSGEGFLSLSRAFFYAGARRVVASLWKVNDRSTAALMKEFYAQLEKGLTPRDALRAAQIQMVRRNDLWRHPYFWSAFVLLQ